MPPPSRRGRKFSAACVFLLVCTTSGFTAPPLPERGAASTVPAKRWEEAFVTGNGRMGAMLFGDPVNETLAANHCRLFLRSGGSVISPTLSTPAFLAMSITRMT